MVSRLFAAMKMGIGTLALQAGRIPQCLPMAAVLRDSDFRLQLAWGPPRAGPLRHPPLLHTLTFRLGGLRNQEPVSLLVPSCGTPAAGFCLFTRCCFTSRTASEGEKRGYFYSIGRQQEAWVIIKVYCFGIKGKII